MIVRVLGIELDGLLQHFEAGVELMTLEKQEHAEIPVRRGVVGRRRDHRAVNLLGLVELRIRGLGILRTFAGGQRHVVLGERVGVFGVVRRPFSSANQVLLALRPFGFIAVAQADPRHAARVVPETALRVDAQEPLHFGVLDLGGFRFGGVMPSSVSSRCIRSVPL